MFMAKLRNHLRKFARDTEGVIAIETMLTLPIIFWTIIGCYTFFDAYRQSASNLKAAYTIGDLISRETQEIDETYVDSMHQLMQIMIRNTENVSMRLTLIAFDEEEDRHFVRWSTVRGFDTEWTDGNIHLMRDRLPPMPNADTLIVVETSNDFQPPLVFGVLFNWGLIGEIELNNFIFTRPRFTNEIAASV